MMGLKAATTAAEEDDSIDDLVLVEKEVPSEANDVEKMIEAEDILEYVFNEALERTFVPVPIRFVNKTFCRVNVPPDGSCFYSSCWIGCIAQEKPQIDILDVDPYLRHSGAKRLRLAVARRLLLSKNRRSRLISAGIDPDSYACDVANGAWADEAEILAASRELRRPVVIFERKPSQKDMTLAWVGGLEQPGTPVALWRKNEHYDALLPAVTARLKKTGLTRNTLSEKDK